MTGALAHEWIAQDGGSENVLEEMTRTFPDADVLCLWNDSRGRFDGSRVRESVLARTPLRRHKAAALPLMPAIWSTFRDHDYDWAMISSHAFAHHLRLRGAPTGFRRMVYVHTPARYIWTRTDDTRGNHPVARMVSPALRSLDRSRARRGAEFAANSRFVRQRIRDAWDVDARVIAPPVRVSRIQSVDDWHTQLSPAEAEVLDGLPDGFVLGASRFIPYKRLEDVVRVGELVDRPVVLAGHGPEEPRLSQLAETARVPVRIVPAPSSALLYALFQRTALYVFPPVEDFGIMPVEAMAAGAPVLGNVRGGTSESVLNGRTGALVGFESAEEIRAGVEIAIATRAEDRRARARHFDSERFRDQLRAWVAEQ